MGRVPFAFICLNSLGDGPVDALGIDPDALLALLGFRHGLHEPGSAFPRVFAAGSCLAVLDDVLALRAFGVISVLFKVTRVNAHLARQSGLGGFSGGLNIRGFSTEPDSFSSGPRSGLVGHCPDTGHGLGVPAIALGTPRDGPGRRGVAVLIAHDEGVASSAVAQEDALCS